MTHPVLWLALVITAQTNDDAKWVELASKDELCRFAMPKQPTEKTTTQKAAGKPVDIQDFSCTSNGCLYRLEQAALPLTIADEKLDGVLAASCTSITRKVKVLESKDVTLGGWPGRELIVEAPLRTGADPSTIAMLLIYTHTEFYQIRVFALEPGTQPKDVRKFFDSVKFSTPRETKKTP